MDKLFTPSKLKVLSGLFTDLSAGWIAAVIIVPNFTDLSLLEAKLVLLLNILSAIVSLIIAFWLEERSIK